MAQRMDTADAIARYGLFRVGTTVERARHGADLDCFAAAEQISHMIGLSTDALLPALQAMSRDQRTVAHWPRFKTEAQYESACVVRVA